MRVEYGFTITKAGRRILAGLLANETLTVSKVMVGKGRVETVEEMVERTDLAEPVALATSTAPVLSEDGSSVSFIVEYRSDLNGGLTEGFWLSEFAVYAPSPDTGEDVAIYYATLGDYPQYVQAYQNGANDIRRFPVTIAIAVGSDVSFEFPPLSFMTAEDVERAIAHAASLGGAYQIDRLELPAQGWEELEEPEGEWKYRYFLAAQGCRAEHIPMAALRRASLRAAGNCGLCPAVEAVDGGLYFWAEKPPQEALTGSYALFAKGSYLEAGGGGYVLPAATADTLGGVKVGDGLGIDASGKLSVVGLPEDLTSTDEAMEAIVAQAYGDRNND